MCRIIFCFDNYKHILEQVENKNVWVKLEKDGNKVNGYYSRNGENWFQVGQQVEISDKYNLEVGQICSEENENFSGNFSSLMYELDEHDWSLCAGIKYNRNSFKKENHSLLIKAYTDLKNCSVEVWIDSFESNNKVAEFTIKNIHDKRTQEKVDTKIYSTTTNKYDVNLRFNSSDAEILF